MDIYEAIKTRKSVRSYLPKEIPDDILTRILDTARLAPSANNHQEWRFVQVREKPTKQKLIKMAGNQGFIAEAPVVLVCCGVDADRRMHCGQAPYAIDVSIIIDHITLLAAAEGLGTCWIGNFEEAPIKELLGIPEPVRIVELLPIGYPADPSPKDKPRLPLEQIVMPEKWH